MTRSRWLLLAVILTAVAAFVLLDGRQYLSVESLQQQRSALEMRRAARPWTLAAGYGALYMAVTALSLPGAAAMTLAGGAVFGFWQGLVLVSFASSLGATLAFLVARFMLGEWVRRRYRERLAAIDAGVERDGAFYLFALRLVPLVPFWLINLAMGLTRMRARTFYAVSQIGMLPGTAVYVYAGTQLGEFRVSPGLLGALALLGVFPLIARRVLEMLRTRRVYARWAAVKPAQFDYNIVVIGAGSGGLVAAYIAAATRARVALVEEHRMGGDCLHTGCVPSKALLRSARLLADIARSQAFGIAEASVRFDFADVMDRVRRVIAAVEPHDSVERYTGLGVEVVAGRARLTSPWTVEVRSGEECRVLSTRSVVIAAGARPFVPPIPGLAEAGYVTSDTVWQLRERPRRLVVLGGGPVGCEMAQAFARLGSTVTQVEMAERLLVREDVEVSTLLQQRFDAEGIRVLTGYTATAVVQDGGDTSVIARHGDHTVRIACDTILVAVGRLANTTGYGLEELGIEVTSARTLRTDDYLQTLYPNIYACGDVVGPFQFTHTASHQAWYATVNALFGTFRRFKADYRVIPRATFTDPEVARVGLNEQEARERGIPVDVARYGIDDLDRAIADEEAHGFVTVLTRPGSDQILGVTIVGAHASDLLAEYVLAMKHGIGLERILGTIHAYPTMAEANKFAAGVWKRSTVTRGQWAFLSAFQAWRRGATGFGGVVRSLVPLLRDRTPAYPPDTP